MVVSEFCDGAVGGDQEVEDVEALGAGVADEFGAGARRRADQIGDLGSVPRPAGDSYLAVLPGRGGQDEQCVTRPAGEDAARAADVEQAITGHAVGGDLGGVQALAAHRLHRIAPQFLDIHVYLLTSPLPNGRYGW